MVEGVLKAGAEAQRKPQQSPMTIYLIMFALIAFSFYFIVLIPQKKEQNARKRLLENLKKGDDIVTIGGIYGTVLDIDAKEGTVQIEVSKNVRIKLLRSAISSVVKQS